MIELIIGGIIGFAVDYIKDCKKNGFLKTTMWAIMVLIITIFLVYNKNSRWF